MNELPSPSGTQNTPREAVAGLISRLWWLMLLRGLLLVVLGVYAIARPAMTLVAWTQVLGMFVLADGVLAVVAGTMGWTVSRVWTIVRGALGILIGMFVLGHPILVGTVTAMAIVFLIASELIAGGVPEVIVAVRERKEIQGVADSGWLAVDCFRRDFADDPLSLQPDLDSYFGDVCGHLWNRIDLHFVPDEKTRQDAEPCSAVMQRLVGERTHCRRAA